MKNLQTVLKAIIRIGIGVFFIVSAILKLLSIEHFELYIYSFNLFNLTLCGLVARVIIACELFFGLLLIIKVKYKFAWWATMLMLIGFSLLLVYVMIFRNDSNCHCMGELVKLKPSWSLIKNLVGIVLLLFVRNEEDYEFRGKRLVFILGIIAALIPPFVLFPIDNVYNLFSKSDNLNYNETAFHALMADSTMQDVHIDNGNYIVGIVSTGCPYCKTSCLKLSEIVDHNHLDTSRIVFFVWGDSTSLSTFQEETKTESYNYVFVSGIQAIRVADGHFPTYLFLTDGEVQMTADIKKLTEKNIFGHLK